MISRREEVARIIDPWAWSQCEWASRDGNDAVLREYLPKREESLAKADRILTALGTTPTTPEAALTPAEQKAQAARCGCRGSDDLCGCQNYPDAITRSARP